MSGPLIAGLSAAGLGFLLAVIRACLHPTGAHAASRAASDETSVWLAAMRAAKETPGLERRMRAALVRQAKLARRRWEPVDLPDPWRHARAIGLRPVSMPEPVPVDVAAATRPARQRREAETGRPWTDSTGTFAAIAAGERP